MMYRLFDLSIDQVYIILLKELKSSAAEITASVPRSLKIMAGMG